MPGRFDLLKYKDIEYPPPQLPLRTPSYLFGSITVDAGVDGYYYFTESYAIVSPEVENIFSVQNELLTSIDEFGFDTTVLGTQYFYVTQYGEDGAVTIFTFLDSSTGAITPTSQGSELVHGWTCSNEECCEKCVPHDSLICTCHTFEQACIEMDPPKAGKCKKDITVIY